MEKIPSIYEENYPKAAKIIEKWRGKNYFSFNPMPN
jgi:hypothetical protein